MGAAPILTILRDGETVKSVALDGEVMLGRAEACVIRLDDRAISRQHAVFRPTSEGVQVERKSEFAPLAVNGAECSRAIVKEGDVISIGPYLMRLTVPKGYRLPEPDPAPGAGSSEPTAPIQMPSAVPAPLAGARSSPLALVAGGAAANGATHDGAGDAGPGELSFSSPGDNGGMPGADGALPGMGGELALSGFDGDPAAGANPGEGDAAGMPGLDAEPAPSSPLPEVNEPSIMISDDASTRVMSTQKLLARLDVTSGNANVSEFDLNLEEGQEIGIGRGKDCEIVLKDKKASRRNSVVAFRDGRYVVRDLSSANGTWVNGEQVDEQPLYSDDVIKIGSTELVFYAESADYPERERDFLKVDGDGAGGEDFGAGNFEGTPAGASAGAYGGGFDAGGASALPLEPPPGGMPGDLAGFPDAAGAVPNHAPGLDPAAMGAVPGILGVSGAAGGAKKKTTLVQKFKALPPRRRLVLGLVLLILFYLVVLDDSDENPVSMNNAKVSAKRKKKSAKGATAATGEVAKGVITFESLSEADKQFVIRKHDLAFDYYKNQEFDKALYELQQMRAKLPDLAYLDTQEIERYVLQAKAIFEQNENNARAKKEEEKRKAEVAALLEETSARMRKRQYEQARELFGKILPLDPENQQVQAWRKEIENWEDEQRLKDQEKQVQKAINVQAWDIFREGLALQKKGRYRAAIGVFAKIRELNPPDDRILNQANAHIARCKAAIRALRDPVLAEAKQLEGAGEFAKAFALYSKATKIDPGHPEGFAGMNRIRGILHDRSKVLYTEAVLAESYSDFATAKKKYNECLRTAPADDIYHERAERKLARFIRALASQPGGGEEPPSQ